MNLEFHLVMKPKCPNKECPDYQNPSPKKGSVVRNGSYKRSSDGKFVRRFYCRSCLSYFSNATFSPCYYQKKRRINGEVKLLLCSGVSQRRAAKLLGVNPKTVVRKFRFLAEESRKRHFIFIEKYKSDPLTEIQFDDLETSEHTKCKPLSVTLAVDPRNRQIINFKVSQMPARGHLAEKARKKYGYRQDTRNEAWDVLMKELKPLVSPKVKFFSDENPHYPKHVKLNYPEATHKRYKGGRGCIVGQGELKKLKFDPLFALNHTCAMLRANMNRLFRRTWCTTKNQKGLLDHVALYVDFHNTFLTEAATS